MVTSVNSDVLLAKKKIRNCLGSDGNIADNSKCTGSYHEFVLVYWKTSTAKNWAGNSFGTTGEAFVTV